MRKILRGHVFYKILYTLCLGFSFLTEAHAQVSGTFTINSALPTGGSNFNSFSAAAAALTGGVNGPVVFNVQAGSGPYTEQVIMNAITGTSATNTITFNCNGVILTFLSTNSNERAGVKLKGADYVTFDNLIVQPQADAATEYGYGFHLLNDADNNTIKNCRITPFISGNNNNEGIVINGNDGIAIDFGNSFCDDNLIQGNTIIGGTRGITLSSNPGSSGGPAVLMNGNKIIGNSLSNFIVNGIQVYFSTNTVIDGNDIAGGPNAVNDLTGVRISQANNSLSILNNRIHGFHCGTSKKLYGIDFTSESEAGKENLIANNLIYDFISFRGTYYGIYSKNSALINASFLNIYHNTIVLDDKSIRAREAYGVYFLKVRDVKLINNLINVTAWVQNWNVGEYLEKTPVRYTSQRNAIYANGTDYSGVGVDVTYTWPTMDEWQEKTGYDFYSSDANPLFTNAAAFNYVPTAQAIDNMALYVNISKDITGAPRHNRWPDVGCFEFTSPSCTTPVTPGKPRVDPDSVVCGGEKIVLGLKNNSAGSTQTYTWQMSTSPTGTYTNVSDALGYHYFETAPTYSAYYRVAVTCGTTTEYSRPIQIIVNDALNPGTYTINSAQPTGGINFQSFRHALKALKCGYNGNIVLNVASGSGPYNEQVIIPDLSSSPTRTITFNGNGATVAYQPKQIDESAVIKLNGADYITLDSLNVNVGKDTTFGFGIQLINNADHNTIKRCTINVIRDSLYDVPIVLNGSTFDPISTADSFNDSNTIASNTLNGGHYGIVVSSGVGGGISTSVGNIISKNTIKDPYVYGIFLSGPSLLLVDSNDISQPTRTKLGNITGIYLFDKNYGVTISRNKIHNLLEKGTKTDFLITGIHFANVEGSTTNPNLVCNNLIYNFKGNGWQNGLLNASSNNVKYYHNTISLDDSASKPISITVGFGSHGLVTTGVEVKDNIFVIRRGGFGTMYCFYASMEDSALQANYNNYYIAPTTTGTSKIGVLGMVEYATLADWLVTRKDSSSISMDPVFYDLSVGDLTPTKIPFENRGTNVGITNDIWNVTRSTSRPDMGAIEFTICRNLTTPVINVDSAGINAIKFSWTASQNTSGYRVSRDGINWIIPSSGAMGTSHIVAGLKPTDSVELMVKALGSRVDCPEYLSQMVKGKTFTDGIFIPNTFTPNGNGQDDEFKVYTKVMKSVRWMVFNQWGEKVFETADLEGKWDGSYKGKPQPIGVYVYVVVGTLADGTKVTKKGTFNLIR